MPYNMKMQNDALPLTLSQGEHIFNFKRIDPDSESNVVFVARGQGKARCSRYVKPQGTFESVSDKMRKDALRYGAISQEDYLIFKERKKVPSLDEHHNLIGVISEARYKMFYQDESTLHGDSAAREKDEQDTHR